MTTPTIDVNKLVEAAKRVQFIHLETDLLQKRQDELEAQRTSLDGQIESLYETKSARIKQLQEAKRHLIELIAQ